MGRLIKIFLAIGLVLGGCASPRPEARLESLPPLAFPVSLAITSAIPDPYYVLAGPSDSYRRFPFNRWAERALAERLATRSGGAGAPEVKVVVHLVSLETSYREVGSGPRPGAPLYSGIPGRSLLAGDELDGDGMHIPSEIHKGAKLAGELRLVREGQTLLQKSLNPEAMVTVYWEDFNAWSYDYGEVLQQVLVQLIKDVEGALQEVPAR